MNVPEKGFWKGDKFVVGKVAQEREEYKNTMCQMSQGKKPQGKFHGLE